MAARQVGIEHHPAAVAAADHHARPDAGQRDPLARGGSALDDQLGLAWEQGLGILAGGVPSTGPPEGIGARRASAPLRAVLHRIGLEESGWLDQVAVTPTCGLAGASPAWARAALEACRAVGRVVRDDEAQGGGEDER